MAATIHRHPAIRTTRIVCGGCMRIAPSLVVELRERLLRNLKEDGWRLTLGEATCPRCVAAEQAPRRTG
jgi:hypothetical protein